MEKKCYEHPVSPLKFSETPSAAAILLRNYDHFLLVCPLMRLYRRKKIEVNFDPSSKIKDQMQPLTIDDPQF